MQTLQKKILIADDDFSVRLLLSQAFLQAGHLVRTTGNLTTLMKWIQNGEGDLVVSDTLTGGESLFDVLPRMRDHRPKVPIIIVTAHNHILTAINAAEAGVFEYLPKPVDVEAVLAAARRALADGADAQASRALAQAAREERLPLIGRSAAMQEVYRTVARLLSTDLTVLITGESGSGKEVVARLLHQMGRRRNGAFVPVNLAATAADRVESKLFGGDDGAPGILHAANGGTLFIDEIDGMPLDAQSRLLRVIDGTEPPIDPKTKRPINVRVVAATCRDLRTLIQQGLFREDLYFRLDVAAIRLPPLRERLEDVPSLARTFLLRAEKEGLPRKAIGAPALERLQRHRWPGNVRELENLIRRICALYAEDIITASIVERELTDLEPPQETTEASVTLSEVVERRLSRYFCDGTTERLPSGLYDHLLGELERPLFEMALTATRGNQLRAAALLGVNRNTLRKKIESLGVEVAVRRRRVSRDSRPAAL